MASIFQNPTHKAQLGYNGFDMSMSNKFTSTTGELLPVYYDILQPGDKVRAYCDINTRTQPVDSAAMCSIKETVDWFFVPIEQIYSLFGSLFYGINDNKTSLVDISNLIPVFPSYLASTANTDFGAYVTNVGPYVDEFGYHTQYRLLSMINYPIFANLNTSSATMGITPYLLCAYQKIYNDFYRIEDRENPNPQAFNLDMYYDNGLGSISTAVFWNQISMLRYAPKKKDFFTNTFISPLFTTGGNSAAPTTHSLSNDFNQWLVSGLSLVVRDSSNVISSVDKGTYVSPENNIPSSGLQPQLNNYLNSSLNPTSIRTMFATQKLLEITRRAGKTYDLQTLAHFGIKPNDSFSDMVRPLGSQSKNVIIGEVLATAAGSNGSESSVLGQVGGRGYSGRSDNNPVTFTADKHGILMAIYHSEVEQEYDTSCFFDRLNTYRNPADWFHAEYDNLGPQPLFRYQSNYDSATSANNSLFYSWQYRWTELKCKFNQVHGAFQINGTLDYWVPSVDSLDFQNLKDFLVSPNQLDKVMLVPFVGTDANDLVSDLQKCYETDPLLHDFNFNVVKSSKMNVYSLEQL